jgi:hypothetical protein
MSLSRLTTSLRAGKPENKSAAYTSTLVAAKKKKMTTEDIPGARALSRYRLENQEVPRTTYIGGLVGMKKDYP